MKKRIYFPILFILIYTFCSSQIIKTELQVAGLTCSLCSKSTERQLRTLDFIDSIGEDLDHATFTLYFKKDKTIDFYQIKKKVEDAGFSVCNMKITCHFNNLNIDSTGLFNYQNLTFNIVGTHLTNFNGDVTFQLIDKGFVTAKEYKIFARLIANQISNSTTRYYHVKL